MPPEVEEAESTVETPAIVDPDGQDDVAVHAEFVGGYTDEHGEGTPTATPETTPTVETPETADPAVETRPKIVQVTEEKLAALEKAAADVEAMRLNLERVTGQVFGKFGGLERTIKEMQEATPAGQAIQVIDDDLKELKAEFPEVAGMTLTALNRIFGKFKGTGFDEAKVTDLVSKGVSAGVANAETRILLGALSDYREDWHEVVGPVGSETPYRQWLATQPQEYQDTINNSMRPGQIVKSIEKFEAHQRQAKKPAPPVDSRRRRIEAAVTPRSSGGAAIETEPSELEAFRLGFKETQT